MNWKVRLTGESFDLEELAKVLISSNLAILKDGEDYYLKSLSFDNTDNVEAIRAKAGEIVTLINGSIMLALDARKPIEVSHIVRVKDNGTREFFVQVSDSVTLRESLGISVQHQDGTVEEFHPGDPIPSWILLAQGNDNIRKMLNYLAKGIDNWVRLYHIYEIVRDDLGSEPGMVTKGYATRKALERFRRTANSPSAAGEMARHAIEPRQTPPNPMSLSEAKSFIKGIVQAWINDKI